MIHLPETKITAAIPTYNRYDLLEKCIDSLVRQTLAVDQYKILVVDNSPPNETANKFKERYDGQGNIHYFIESTPGLSNARNVAARLCNSDYIAYIDDDAIADVGWLQSILHGFEKFGSQAGVVCGKVSPIWPGEPPKWLPPSLFPALTIVDRGDLIRIAQPGEGFAGTNFAARVTPLLELGGFSHSLGRVGNSNILLSNEEQDLIERMRVAGHLTIWAPDAKVEHLVHAERLSLAWLRKRYAWQAVSDFIADPDGAVKNLQGYRQSVASYVQHWPPHERTRQTSFSSIDDAALVEQQIHATYCLMILLLAGQDIEASDATEEREAPLDNRSHSGHGHPGKLVRAILALLQGDRGSREVSDK